MPVICPRQMAFAVAFLAFGASPSNAQQVLREQMGASRFQQFGSAVTSLGDVTGDGVPDYAVASGTFFRPRSPIYELATFSGVDGRQLWRLSIPDELCSLAAAGDLNGDGRGDLWIVVNLQGIGNRFAVDLRNGATGQPLRRVMDRYSYSCDIATIADVDGDGLPDYCNSSRTTAASPFVVEMRSGSSSQVLWSSPGLGVSGGPANAGDCDGDGMNDVVFGDYSPERIHVLSGRTGAVIRTANTPRSDIGFGQAVCGLGDVDGDGRSEVGIGAPADLNPSSAWSTGSVMIYSPARDLILRTLYLPLSLAIGGPGTPSGFGISISGDNDLDEDGVRDLCAAAPDLDVACVFSGRSGRRILEVQGLPGDKLGDAMASAGDLDGDGRPEWLLSAPRASRGLREQGQVLVMNGRYFANADSLGPGCSTAARPEPRLFGNAAPVLGHTFELWNGASSPAVVLMGEEAVLPRRVGVSACYFYVELSSAAMIGVLPASSMWSLPIPADRTLIGLPLCFQAAIAEGSGATYGFVLSNGLRLRFGW